MPASISGHLIICPLFQWDLLKDKQVFQDSQVQHFLLSVSLLKLCHLQGKSCCYYPYVVHSFFGIMGLDEGDSFQLDLLAALFYPAAYLFTSIFLHCNLSSILFIGLILSPAEIQEHCRVPAGSRRNRAHAVQKGEWFIVVWIYYQLFPFPSLLRTIVLEQHKLLLADLCIFVPTPSVRSHLTDIYWLCHFAL